MLASPTSKKKRSRPTSSLAKQKQLDCVPKSRDPKEPRPYFTYSEVPFCLFCKRTSSPLLKLPSGIFINLTGYVHEICLKNKACCECGVLGLCYRCTVKDCQRLIHLWCGQSLYGNANYCDLHSSTQKKKDSSRTPFIKAICRKVLTSSIWEKDYKEKDSPASLCNGFIFWYILSLEYFPQGQDLSIFPNFPLCSQFALDYKSFNSGSSVNDMIEKLTKDLQKCQKNNEEIINEAIGRSREKVVNEEYLDLIDEGKGKVSSDLGNSTKSEEVFCGICGEGEEVEGFLMCKKCFVTVHGRCYRVVPEGEFICEVCRYSPIEQKCFLCPKQGGILRKTMHLGKDFQITNSLFLNKDHKSEIWVHCFCALHTQGVNLRNQTIDLSSIDISRLFTLCEICNSKEGYCVQCSFPQCSTSFHPECGKELFVSSKSNEKKIFCALHKPVKLRKMLENRQKIGFEDLYKFCKAIEKYLTRTKIPVKVYKKKRIMKTKNLTPRVFSSDEDLLLEYKIQQFLYKLNLSQKVPFSININLNGATRCSKVNIVRPEMFTLVSPSVILEENIHIDHRSAEECFKRYQDTMFNKLKNEMLLLGNRICMYQGTDNSPPKNHSKPKKRKSELVTVSSDTYCICNQPYYYEIPWMAEWSQEEWESKVRENEMIECTKCEKWFHLRCVGYEGSLEKAQQDENWKCGICDEKKIESFLDIRKIVGDIKQGVVTRRATRIQ